MNNLTIGPPDAYPAADTPEHRPGTLQTVFRVQLGRAKDVQEFGRGPNKKTPRPRRAHHKSRTGCHNCKRRRVKCDEAKDEGCLRCQQYGIECDYLRHGLPGKTVGEGDVVGVVGPVSATGAVKVGITNANRRRTTMILTPGAETRSGRSQNLFLDPSFSPTACFSDPLPSTVAPGSETLYHFQSSTYLTFSSRSGQQVFKTSIVALAHHHDYLMHALLGTAASHLAVLKPKECGTTPSSPYRRAEAYHWVHAIQLYQRELARGPDKGNMDALISTCMLLGLHAFGPCSSANSQSFVEVPRHERRRHLDWLSIQAGFKGILHQFRPFLASSVWFTHLIQAVPAERGFTVGPISAGWAIYEAFLDICQVDSASMAENHPYVGALRDLFALLDRGRPSMEEFGQLMALMSRLTHEFRELLFELDHRALLIFAYWLALLYDLRLWWSEHRAFNECSAVIRRLSNSHDARIRILLKWPAQVIGVAAEGSM